MNNDPWVLVIIGSGNGLVLADLNIIVNWSLSNIYVILSEKVCKVDEIYP